MAAFAFFGEAAVAPALPSKKIEKRPRVAALHAITQSILRLC